MNGRFFAVLTATTGLTVQLLPVPVPLVPRTIAPSTLAAPAAIGAPTVTRGPVTVSPGSLAAPPTIGAATVSPGPVTVAPATLAAPGAVGSPTVSQGGATGPIDLGVDGLEQAIKDEYGSVYAGAGGGAFDTTTTVTTLAALQTAINAAQGDYSKRWRILCDWNGRLPGSTVAIGASGATAGWSDAGGVLYIAPVGGKTPAIGAQTTMRGNARGVHIRGVGLANFYSGTGDPQTQYGLQLVKNGTYPGHPIVRVEDAGIGAGFWGGVEADYVTGIQTSPGLIDGQLVLWNTTLDGVRSGLKVPLRRLRAHGLDIKRDVGDAISAVGHTTGELYRAVLWLSQYSWRKPIDTFANRINHMDGAQTDTAADTHLGYDVLITDSALHAGHSYAGDNNGGGTQGSYNYYHGQAQVPDNRFCLRRTTIATTGPAGFRLNSPAATHRSYVDRCTLTRAGRVPSGFTGDEGAAQDFMTGIVADASHLPAPTGVYCAVTDSLLGTMDTAGGRITYTGCQLVDPRIGAASGIRPETIMAGREFTRAGAAANGVTDKFGYDLPNEDGTQAQFIADVSANFAPKVAYAGKGAPDLTGLTWAAPMPPAGAQTVSPASLAVPAAIGAPTIVPGAVSVAPATLAAAAAIGAPTVAAAAPISSVDANGWSAQWLSGTPPTFTPDTSPQTIAISRQGFDATGAATTYNVHRIPTLRLRNPADTNPFVLSYTASGVVLDDYVYSTDTIAGVTNGSAEASPKPVVQWVTPHRLPVGTTIGGSAAPVELVAAHRDARNNREVAAVIFKITDGTTTISVTVAATVISGRAGDRFPVIVYQLPATDISSLTAGLITVNAEVYPWIGAAASVAKSASDGNDARGFSPRYFWKSAATPYIAYVASTGNNTSGVASQTDATAAASPCLTLNGALAKINAAAGKVDGAIIYVVDTVLPGGTAAANLTQNVGAVTITRAPGTAKAAAIVQHGVAWIPKLYTSLAVPTSTGAVIFKDLTFQRTVNAAITSVAGTPLEVIFDASVAFDGGSINGTYLSNAHDYHFGTTFTNITGASTLGAGGFEHRLWRGVGLNVGTTATSMEGWAVVGCDMGGPVSFQGGSRSLSGALVAFSTFRNCPTVSYSFEVALAADVTGYAHLQNVYEFTSTTTSPTMRVTGDGGTGNVSHFIMHNCTFAGGFQCGRWNMLYDDGTTRRTSKLQSFVGNIAVSIYTKSDIFIATNNNSTGSPSTSAAATGNWAFSMGVGCRGQFSQHQSATALGGNEAQMYPGLAAKIGTSTTVRQDPLFTTNGGTTYNGSYTAGAGNGVYTLQSGSPAKAMVTRPVLSHDLAGAARSTTSDSAGAYG